MWRTTVVVHPDPLLTTSFEMSYARAKNTVAFLFTSLVDDAEFADAEAARASAGAGDQLRGALETMKSAGFSPALLASAEAEMRQKLSAPASSKTALSALCRTLEAYDGDVTVLPRSVLASALGTATLVTSYKGEDIIPVPPAEWSDYLTTHSEANWTDGVPPITEALRDSTAFKKRKHEEAFVAEPEPPAKRPHVTEEIPAAYSKWTGGFPPQPQHPERTPLGAPIPPLPGADTTLVFPNGASMQVAPPPGRRPAPGGTAREQQFL